MKSSIVTEYAKFEFAYYKGKETLTYLLLSEEVAVLNH
jgi:hypothetical protein